jgi:hypothetical protein
MTDEEILNGFSHLIDRIVKSFDDFTRPEFCKINEVT